MNHMLVIMDFELTIERSGLPFWIVYCEIKLLLKVL